jgi:hypothetical protein
MSKSLRRKATVHLAFLERKENIWFWGECLALMPTQLAFLYHILPQSLLSVAGREAWALPLFFFGDLACWGAASDFVSKDACGFAFALGQTFALELVFALGFAFAFALGLAFAFALGAAFFWGLAFALGAAFFLGLAFALGLPFASARCLLTSCLVAGVGLVFMAAASKLDAS